MERRVLALVGSLLLTVGSGASAARAAAPTPPCPAPKAGTGYEHRLQRALSSTRDVWGERLLQARNGPTLAAARGVLAPLLYADAKGGRPLTRSGVYYLPLTLPVSVGGARGFGLHVADGSEIIVRRVDGPSLTIAVGRGGGERFGSCLARLQTPRLAQGYLPILQVGYRDRAGVRYAEESFVGRRPHGSSLVSFVRVTADASRASGPATIRLTTSTRESVQAVVRRGETIELDAAFVHHGAHLRAIDSAGFVAARTSVIAFWQQSIATMPSYVVPEQPVMDAERALVIQELELTWRYSVGNSYEELSYAEALDVAQVMAAYGYGDVARQILRFTLRRLPVRFTNWRAGERLVAGAQYFRLTGDRRYVAEEAPALTAVVERFARELASSANGLLPRERYSSDIPDQIYSLQGQTLVWQGLLAMSRVWSQVGRAELATRSRLLAVRLEGALRRAVHSSERRLTDGSIFVPAGLLDPCDPFRNLTSSQAGTYWNLVTPYALASGFFAPHSLEADGLLRYLERHGSRLLGLVRAGAYRLAGADGSVTGTDQVYGINVARFLADQDQPDQLDLSLYGTLAAALTPGTFVAGEAASVSPIHGLLYRAMYLPPNNDAGATYLETLRLTLVHERRGPSGLPRALELAFATPRSWLRDQSTIDVHAAPTSFGPISYRIERHGNIVRATIDAPKAASLRTLQLRLRLPAGERLTGVEIAGSPVSFDRATGTIDLPTHGEFELVASVVTNG